MSTTAATYTSEVQSDNTQMPLYKCQYATKPNGGSQATMQYTAESAILSYFSMCFRVVSP